MRNGRAAIGVFHKTFFAGVISTGRLVSLPTPEELRPRKAGQSAARDRNDGKKHEDRDGCACAPLANKDNRKREAVYFLRPVGEEVER